MSSVPNQCYASNEMNPTDIDRVSMEQYRYDGSHLNASSNTGVLMGQTMYQGDQMQQQPMHSTMFYNSPMTNYNGTTPEYDTRYQPHTHVVQGNNIAGANGQNQMTSMNPPPYSVPPARARVIAHHDPMWQHCGTSANQPHQNYQNSQSQMQPSYPPSHNSSSGYSSYPPSHSNSQNPPSNGTWQQPYQYVDGAIENSAPFPTTNFVTQSSWISENPMKCNGSEQPYQQPINTDSVSNVVTEARDTSSKGTMNINVIKRPRGRPIEIACCEEHKRNPDRSCKECEKLRDQSHTRSVGKNTAKNARKREDGKMNVELLTKIYNHFQRQFTDLREQPGLPAPYKRSIDIALRVPELVNELPPTAEPEKQGTRRQENPSRRTLATRKSRAKAKEKELDNANKIAALATQIRNFLDIFEFMGNAVALQVVQNK